MSEISPIHCQLIMLFVLLSFLIRRLGSTMRHLRVIPIGGLTSSVLTKTQSVLILTTLVERLSCLIGATQETTNLPYHHPIVDYLCTNLWAGQ